MKLDTIEDLFNNIRDKFQVIRSNNKHFDGQALWQTYKNILSESKWNAKKWVNSASKETIHKILSMPEFYINGYDKTMMIEQNHFIIQSYRIPLKEEPSLRKVMQVALNIGQYKGIKQKDATLSLIIPDNITAYISKTESNILLKDIMTPKNINNIQALLNITYN